MFFSFVIVFLFGFLGLFSIYLDSKEHQIELETEFKKNEEILRDLKNSLYDLKEYNLSLHQKIKKLKNKIGSERKKIKRRDRKIKDIVLLSDFIKKLEYEGFFELFLDKDDNICLVFYAFGVTTSMASFKGADFFELSKDIKNNFFNTQQGKIIYENIK